MKRKLIIRYILLGVLLLLVWMTQSIPALGNLYSQTVYPVISRVLSFFSNLFPFAIGDLFIFGSITGVIVYPFYARIRKKLPWKRILLRDGEYLLWVYVWFYLAWGLNYSQPNFYQRTHIPYTAYTPEIFQEFVDDYIDSLNSSFVPVKGIHEEQVRDEAVKLYNQLSDSLGVHRPPFPNPRVKTMVFTPFISMVGVTGSMGPFFCEFTLNGDLLPINYPATYIASGRRCLYEKTTDRKRRTMRWLRLSLRNRQVPESYPVTNIIKCKNPRCITSIEQELPHKFKLTNREHRIYRCVYCESKFKGN